VINQSPLLLKFHKRWDIAKSWDGLFDFDS
jgi:hypothetical protein